MTESRKNISKGKPKKPAKKANEPEFAQYLWLPWLGEKHAAGKGVAASVLSRLIAHKEFSHERVEKNAEWQAYKKELHDMVSSVPSTEQEDPPEPPKANEGKDKTVKSSTLVEV